MAVVDLTFEKVEETGKAARWVGDFVSSGMDTVEIERIREAGSQDSNLIFCMSLDGMEWVAISDPYGRYSGGNQIFQINAQSGVNIRIISYAEVTGAKVLTSE